MKHTIAVVMSLRRSDMTTKRQRKKMRHTVTVVLVERSKFEPNLKVAPVLTVRDLCKNGFRAKLTIRVISGRCERIRSGRK